MTTPPPHRHSADASPACVVTADGVGILPAKKEAVVIA